MKKIVYLSALFVFFSISSLAIDNVTMTSLYSITDFAAYSDSSVSESYSHVYAPDDDVKSGVDNYYNLKSQGVGLTRVHNIMSIDSVGNAYVSSYAGYKTADGQSYMTAGDRIGFQTCYSKNFCDDESGKVATASSMGYSAKLYDGSVEQFMVATPGPFQSAEYSLYSTANGSGNQLNSGVSVSNKSSSGSIKQSYENHISVTGQFRVYHTAETR